MHPGAERSYGKLVDGISSESDVAKFDSAELREWLDSLNYVLQSGGPEHVKELLNALYLYAYERGVRLPFSANTPYVNTIPIEEQPPFPGNREIERRIKSLIRWNASRIGITGHSVPSAVTGGIHASIRNRSVPLVEATPSRAHGPITR